MKTERRKKNHKQGVHTTGRNTTCQCYHRRQTIGLQLVFVGVFCCFLVLLFSSSLFFAWLASKCIFTKLMTTSTDLLRLLFLFFSGPLIWFCCSEASVVEQKGICILFMMFYNAIYFFIFSCYTFFLSSFMYMFLQFCMLFSGVRPDAELMLLLLLLTSFADQVHVLCDWMSTAFCKNQLNGKEMGSSGNGITNRKSLCPLQQQKTSLWKTEMRQANKRILTFGNRTFLLVFLVVYFPYFWCCLYCHLLTTITLWYRIGMSMKLSGTSGCGTNLRSSLNDDDDVSSAYPLVDFTQVRTSNKNDSSSYPGNLDCEQLIRRIWWLIWQLLLWLL